MKLAGSVFEELWFAEDDGDIAADEASESLAAKLAEVEGLKTFPVVAQKILSILGNPDFRVVEVTRALEEDPSLATSVLRMANSAFFGGTNPVSSISQAFVRLGGRTVKEVVCAVATMEMFPDTDGLGKHIRDHSASTAAISQFLSREFAPKYVEGIFLCGLLHDVGKMLLMDSGEIVYSTKNIQESMEPDKLHIQERGILGYDHAVLAAHAARSWKLPDKVSKVIAWHHQPSRAFQDQETGTMVAILRIADQIDYQLRYENEEYEGWIDEYTKGSECQFAGVTEHKLKEKWVKIFEARNGSLALFSGK